MCGEILKAICVHTETVEGYDSCSLRKGWRETNTRPTEHCNAKGLRRKLRDDGSVNQELMKTGVDP